MKFLLTKSEESGEFTEQTKFSFNYELVPKQRKFPLPTVNLKEKINKGKRKQIEKFRIYCRKSDRK